MITRGFSAWRSPKKFFPWFFPYGRETVGYAGAGAMARDQRMS
jgi:hypothetical protein